MIKIISFFIITLFTWLYVPVGILLVCLKHLRDRTISLRGDGWAHKTNFTQRLFFYIKVHVPSQVSDEGSCICVFGYRFWLFL